MTKITVYSTEPCSFCVRAKALLDSRGLDYEEINLAKDAVGRTELVQRTGMMSFPQIIIGDEIVGGFSELVEADRAGILTELAAAA
jgi:glutaredoxin 3